MNNQVLRASAVNLVIFGLLLPGQVHAATLRSETAAAWEEYVRAANSKLQERVRLRGQFLWTLEDSERAAKVRSGEIVVAPTPGPNPRKVPGGMIHHWVGAAFFPNLTIEDILAVTRDYDHYKNFFTPSVVDSRVVSLDGPADRFSMLLMNEAFFLATALDADHELASVRLDDCRVYSIARTTRVQEIEEYGHSGQHRVPEGEGSGIIWKLYSVSRLEQRDGGVYVEVEDMALSRDIPTAIRFMANPIVRRFSRNALLLSLRQTENAVRGHAALSAQRAVVTVDAGRFGSMQSAFTAKTSVNTEIH